MLSDNHLSFSFRGRNIRVFMFGQSCEMYGISGANVTFTRNIL